MIKQLNSIKFIYKGTLEIDEDTKIKIQKYWNLIKEEKVFLKESKILIVTNITNKNDNFILELKETTFSNYMYAKINGDIKPLFSGAYVITKDNYLMTVLNHYYENELEFETLNLVGGMSDSKDIISGEYQSITCLQREIKEEIGLDIDNNNYSINLKYIKYPNDYENKVNYAIGTIYEIKTKYTKNELIRMFEESTHDNEIKELVFFTQDNYKEIYNYKHKKQYIPELFELIYNEEGK